MDKKQKEIGDQRDQASKPHHQRLRRMSPAEPMLRGRDRYNFPDRVWL